MEEREYERMAASEDRHWWYRELRLVWGALLRDALDRAGPAAPPLRILDAGCGTGGNLPALRAFGGCVVGIDRSALALRLAARRLERPPLARADVLALPFPDGCFDVILCADVLYHRGVSDDRAALAELRRLLRPRGVLLVNVPAFESLRSAHDGAVHTARRYTAPQVRERLAAAGLRPLRVAYWNGLLLPFAVAVRLARKRSAATSDVVDLPRALNALLSGIARIDAAAARRGLLPAGLSVAASARRDA